MNNNKKNSEQSSGSQDIQIARLAFIGASIVTLGDLISTLAAGLALDALEKSKNGDSGPRRLSQKICKNSWII